MGESREPASTHRGGRATRAPNRLARAFHRRTERATPEDPSLNRQLADGAIDLVGALHAAGVTLLTGTDSPFSFVLPGFSLHQELELLVAAGLSPGEALAAATRNGADLLGLLDDRGTIDTGKRADLVLLDADPLADIHNTREIAAVVAGGVLYSREDLDRLPAGQSPNEP